MTNTTHANAPGRALICGSLAYDTIMVFPDRFAAHILPDKIHMLNVAFLVPELRREFGGCAGNIAYNLRLLGDAAFPMATAGRDFDAYAQWMVKTGVPRDYVKVIETEHTAQAFITTDRDDNQITAFHPGAMQHAHVNRVADARGITIGIVAPDGRRGMIEHAADFAAAGIPFIFDPGQGLPMFEADDLQRFISQASWVAVNDYEWQLMQQKTGWSVDAVLEKVRALIVTRGAAGSVIHTAQGELAIPSATCAVLRTTASPGASLRSASAQALAWHCRGRTPNRDLLARRAMSHEPNI